MVGAMGLDTTHNCYHGAYGSFARFRNAIQDAAGDLPFLDATGEFSYSYHIVGKTYPARCYYGWWDAEFPYDDVLEVLFVHADCEGYIFPRDGEDLANRLEGFIEKVDPEEQPSVRQFINGLRRAAAENEIVRFY